jgi:hypothetical protein
LPASLLASIASSSCPCLQALADALEQGDADAFTAAVADFDSLTRLDAWKTTMLVGLGQALV